MLGPFELHGPGTLGDGRLVPMPRLMFPGPRARKVLRDTLGNKPRALLVILSIAVGVFASGAMASARVILSRDLQA